MTLRIAFVLMALILGTCARTQRSALEQAADAIAAHLQVALSVGEVAVLLDQAKAEHARRANPPRPGEAQWIGGVSIASSETFGTATVRVAGTPG